MTAKRSRRMRRWLLALGVTTALLGPGEEASPQQSRSSGQPSQPTALPASATATQGVLLRLCGCAAAALPTNSTDEGNDQ